MNKLASELVPGALVQIHTVSFALFFHYVPCHQNSLGGNLTNDDHTTVGDALMVTQKRNGVKHANLCKVTTNQSMKKINY